MPERIQKLIASAGIASRRAAEELIREGRVMVNGQPAQLGQQADPAVDRITIDGERLSAEEKKVYIMLNKPRGYVTTLHDEKGRKTVAELVSGAGVRVFPVGRLDMDSEGLLLLTNDGDAANRLMHPSHGVEKTYHVRVTGQDMEKAVRRLREPFTLDGAVVQARRLELLECRGNTARLSVTIGEGKNRQVRRMCALAGLTVRRLERVSEGELSLGDLPRGKWRLLTPKEIESLHL